MGQKSKSTKVPKAMATMPENLNPSMEIVAPQLKMQSLSSRKKACAITRRSERLRNLAPPAQNQEIESMVVEEINLCESEKEDEPHVEENPPNSMPAQQRLEEKINYLVQAIKELKSKAAERHFRSDSPAMDHKYKSLYFDLQQKIEALTKENQELSRKLDVALGKIEVYEETRRASSEVLEKLKDVILISNLAKATETAMNLSSQAILAGFSSPSVADEPNAAVELQASAKRKKQSKGNKDN